MKFYCRGTDIRPLTVETIRLLLKISPVILMVLQLSANAAPFVHGRAHTSMAGSPIPDALVQKVVSGKVTDNNGQPLAGVSIQVRGGAAETSTDTAGRFKISLTGGNAVLVFSFVGYDKKEVAVNAAQGVLNVIMAPSTSALDEVVVVGYGQQKRVTITGSVASVSGSEIVTTKSQNLQNSLTGKVPGLRVVQRTSEPGTFDNQFDIRGFGGALIVVDGVPRNNSQRIDASDIESISVLKDASAAVYGVRAANGVVLITTKKGASGKSRIEYSYMGGFQSPSGLPKPLGAVDRAVLFNEQSMHSLNDPRITISDEEIQPYIDGTRQEINWYDRVMRNNAPQSQQNLSASGGTDKVDYYINLGYSYQGGFWKSNDLNYKKYNFRTNLNATLAKGLQASLKLSGITDQQDRPFRDSWEIFKNLWRARPDDYYYANDNPLYIFKNQSDYNPGAISNADISGFHKLNNKIFQSSFSLDYAIPGVSGLTAKGVFSYDLTILDRTDYQKMFPEYEYNAITDVYTPVNYQVPSQITRNYGNNPSQLLQVSLNYKKTLGGHSIDALALLEQTSSTGDGFFAQRQLSISIPYIFAGNAANQVGNANSGDIYEFVNKGVVGRVDYNYLGKYLFNFSFRYDGSSKFPPSRRWGFFPSFSGGWRISEEGFFKNLDVLSFISDLKLRGSYGVLGDDQASTFQFITGYDYPFSGGNPQGLASGYLFDGWTSSLGFRSVANPNITWFTSKMTNLGLDAEFLKGRFGLTLDLFERNRSGLLANRLLSLPLSFGSELPQENLNSDRTQGFELALTSKNRLSEDIDINLGANVALTRTMNRYIERPQDGSSYAKWRNDQTNRYNDVWFGWGDAGQYQSYDQIRNSPIYTSRGTLPGDYIYEDWNGDGTIDDADRYPIATSTNPNSDFNGRRNNPLINFGFTINARYKNFDIDALFQGTARAYASYGEMYQILTSNALDFFMDRWHPEDPKKDPYDPTNVWIPGRLAYTPGAAAGAPVDQNSKRGIQNASYVRLKSIELGYTFPTGFTRKFGVNNLRVFANGYNLLTLSGVIGIDPEHPSDIYGYMYPMNKTINFGVSLML